MSSPSLNPNTAAPSSADAHLPLHGDRSKEHSLGAVGQDHLPAIRLVELHQGLGAVEKVDFEDLFAKDAVVTDPISAVKGVDNIRRKFTILNSILLSDIGGDQAPSEATTRLSVQKVDDFTLKILLDKKVKCKVAPKLTGVAGTGSVAIEEWAADDKGYDHFVFSTEMTVSLDPVGHKIQRIEVRWPGISEALAPGTRGDLPQWFLELQRQRRELTFQAARENW